MESLTSSTITVGVHCLKLRTKGMYVQSIVDPDEPTFYDNYDNAVYWCVKTQTGFGPDGEPVRPEACRGGRGCCQF
jgi:hypothetical protein